MSLREGWIVDCTLCGVHQVVCGPNTPGGAMLEAQKLEWFYLQHTNQWYCPLCK